MKSAPASIACWKAGPGLALSELILIISQPSASVAASTPTVMYGHDSSSHSSQANFFGSGTPVSGIVTPIGWFGSRYCSTTARAAATPGSSSRGRRCVGPVRVRCLGAGRRLGARTRRSRRVGARRVGPGASVAASVRGVVVVVAAARGDRGGRPRGAPRSAFGWVSCIPLQDRRVARVDARTHTLLRSDYTVASVRRASVWGAPLADVLRIEHLSKTFPGQVALSDVSITVDAGEVHALVGQNGSGKSTLIKVLSGYHQPDPGASAWANGEPLTLGDGHAASRRRDPLRAPGPRARRLAQRGREHRPHGRLPRRDSAAGSAGATRCAAPARRWPCSDSPTSTSRRPISELPPSQRTAVAIARALVGWEDGAHLLVLDEPTATLPGDDVHRLFEVVHRLKERGVSIVYVSHHLDEVFELADRVTVLRDGKLAATVPVSELDHMRLVELIVGHHIETTTATRGARERSTAGHGPRPAAAAPCTASTSTSTPARSSGSPASPVRGASTCCR